MWNHHHFINEKTGSEACPPSHQAKQRPFKGKHLMGGMTGATQMPGSEPQNQGGLGKGVGLPGGFCLRSHSQQGSVGDRDFGHSIAPTSISSSENGLAGTSHTGQ